jgi:hypothetical protein
MQETYIIVGLIALSITASAVVWVVSNNDSNLEYPAEPRPLKKKRGRKSLLETVYVERILRWISESPEKAVAKSTLMRKLGWNNARTKEFLSRNSHAFKLSKSGRGTLVSAK